MNKKTLEEKLQNYVVDSNGCWIWQGTKNWGGYGMLSHERKTTAAHRFSYTYHKGEIPEGFEIDHLCKVTLCINPAHLEAVTNKENTLRSNAPSAQNAKKTHCLRGHEFSPENTFVNSQGGRVCKACHQMLKVNRLAPAICDRCGKEFLAYKLRPRSKHTFCSTSCSTKYARSANNWVSREQKVS